MATINLKELKYENQLVLVEMARRALKAKMDAEGNIITSTYATKAEVEALKAIHLEIVETLPTTGQKTNVIYLVKKETAGTQNVYDEYIWIVPETGSAHWEKIGSTEVDLSNYYTKDDIDLIVTGLEDALDEKVDKVSGKSLVSDSEITKLEGVSEGANKVEASSNNGKIKIDGSEVTVYTSKVSATDVSIDW